ncbi:MAG: hypothetical protein AABW73_04775 [Nanoarchaeota archaeon]
MTVTIDDLTVLDGLRVRVENLGRVDGEIKIVNSYEGVVLRTPRCDGRATMAVAHRDGKRLSWTNLYPAEKHMNEYAVIGIVRGIERITIQIPGSGGGYYDHQSRGVTQDESDNAELALLEAGL